jgi:lysophospholipase L1-like esterase
MRFVAWLWLLVLGGCSDEPRFIEPAAGPQSGYFTVRVADPSLDPASAVGMRAGGNKAYDLVAEDEDVLRATLQGEPEPGPVDLQIDGVTIAGGFAYEPPSDPRFARLVAIGASLTQGVQNGVPTYHGGFMSPPAQLARQLGGYFPLPLLVRDFLPQIGPADLGPPPACAPPDIVAFVAAQAFEVLPKLSDGYQLARIDPDIDVRNVAVGGARIATVVHGPPADDFAANFVARLVYDPYNAGPVERSQLDVVDATAPTIVVSTDLYGNDVAAALLVADVIDPSLMTPLASFEADLALLVDRLSATGAEMFIANLPKPSLLPLTADKRARMIELAVEEARNNGGDERAAAQQAAARADQAIAEVDAHAAAFNDLLVEAAAGEPRLHVVDLAARVSDLAQTGLEAGGQSLSTQKLGGLLGFDGVHFTDTGYAMIANAFVETFNSVLGTQVPLIDLGRIVASDPGSPAAIAAAGIDVTQCDR